MNIFLLITTCSAALQAGLKTSLDIAVINQAKDAYFNAVLSLINDVTLPDKHKGNGDYFNDNSFHVIDHSKNVDFYPDPSKNAMVVRNRKVSAIARTKHFRYKVAPLIVAKGSAEVEMHTIDITAGLSFSTRKLPSGNIVPYVKAADVKVDINRWDIKIHIHGDFVADLAEVFSCLFKNEIAGDIEKALTKTLTTGIPELINFLIG